MGFQGPQKSPQANRHSIYANVPGKPQGNKNPNPCLLTAGCYPTKTHRGTVFEETDVVSLTFWMRKATQISVSGTLMMSSLLLSPPSTNQPNVWLELPAREPPTPALTGRAHFVRLGFLIGWYCHVPLCCLDKNRLPKNYKNSSGHWQHEKPNMLYS